MLFRIRSSSFAAALALIAWTGSVQAASILRITEVMSNGDVADWFELTNYGTDAATLSGYKMDDNSFAFVSAVPLVSSTSNPGQAITIGVGESVVFIEGSAANPLLNVATFRTNWGLSQAVQVYGYGGAGVGLSSGGDGVTVFDSAGTSVTGNVTFGAATTGQTFTWSYDELGTLKTNASGLPVSAIGLNGAVSGSNGVTALVGSPGRSVLVSSTTVTLAAPLSASYGGKYGAGASTGAVWVQGDFNYSNGTTLTDITLLNNTGLYNAGSYLPTATAGLLSLSGLPVLGAGSGSGGLALMAAVPEPTTWALAVAGICWLAGGRRRRGGSRA